MLLEKKNLVKELLSERSKFKSDKDILDEIKSILMDNESSRAEIRQGVKEKSSTNSNDFNIELMETDKIFHLEQIKKICIDYRLRFLDSHLFKNDIPEEAITKIHHLEKNHHIKLEGFKIVAPSKLFHLKNYDDPLLFVPIGNDYFYLIHKWGNDLNPFRKTFMRPFKTMENFILLILVASLLFAAIVPLNALGKVNENVLRLVSFLFIFKSLAGISLYYCFWKGKNFNEDIWRSEYYN